MSRRSGTKLTPYRARGVASYVSLRREVTASIRLAAAETAGGRGAGTQPVDARHRLPGHIVACCFTVQLVSIFADIGAVAATVGVSQTLYTIWPCH